MERTDHFPALGRRDADSPPKVPAGIAFAYLLFVIYGSLVPLKLRFLSFDQAWATFLNVRMLDVGVQGRADWIANGVLYVPVGLLMVLVLTGRDSVRRPPIIALIGALFISFALAIAIEFAQLYFPPRTVSLNDLMAEGIGALCGVLISARWSVWLRSVTAALSSTRQPVAGRLLELYAIAYLAYSFFPFDFLLSTVELDWKLQSGAWGWLISTQGLSTNPLVLAAKLVAEMFAAVPFGLLVVYRLKRPRVSGSMAFLTGLALGFGIESIQLLMASGISQGASILTRAAGVWAGAEIAHRIARNPAGAFIWLRRRRWTLSTFYVLGVAAINGWFTERWGGFDVVPETLGQVRFLPFYYHYYTSEAVALTSLTTTLVMYVPVGLLAWFASYGARTGALAAFILATVIESARLILPGPHPDPTNTLIAAFSAWATVRFTSRLVLPAPGRRAGSPATKASGRHRTHPSCGASAEATRDDLAHAPIVSMDLRPFRDPRSAEPERVAVEPAAASGVTSPPVSSDLPGASGNPSLLVRTGRSWLAAIGLAASLAIMIWGLLQFPVQPTVLGIIFFVYGLLVWRRPQLILAALPAALPVFDLAPWSGRFFVSEFEFLVILSLGIGFARTAPPPPSQNRGCRSLPVLLALLSISLTVSVLRGMQPWQWPDANSFNNYYSPFNALRIGQGALWAFLLMALAARLRASGADVRRLFAMGLTAGLAATVAVILWERIVFAGLLNFSSDYRVIGPFSQMHTGGAQVECFLTVAMPFAVALLVQIRNAMFRFACIGLLILATYALMVTFSRGGYAGYGVAFATVIASAILESQRTTGKIPIQRGAAALILMTLSLAIALPIANGEHAQRRMANVGADLTVREKHWQDVIEIRDEDWATAIFGMGVGRFPETHFWRSGEGHSATYQLRSDGGDNYLQLGSGRTLYMEQYVAVQPHSRYLLSFRSRSAQPRAQISVAICEKAMLTSFRCAFRSFQLAPGIEWNTYQAEIDSGDIASGSQIAKRPVKLSIFESDYRASLDVDEISLRTVDGIELVSNGNFSEGLDRWFFSTDDHLPWHAKNIPLAVLFDQGWFGLLTTGAVAFLAIGRAGAHAWRGDLMAGALLAAVVGMLVIGLFDTLIDNPRFLLLFLLLFYFASQTQRRAARQRPDQSHLCSPSQ